MRWRDTVRVVRGRLISDPVRVTTPNLIRKSRGEVRALKQLFYSTILGYSEKIARPRKRLFTMASQHPYQKLDIDERVKRVLLKTPLIDGHNDLPQQPRAIFHGKIHNNPKFDLEKGFQRGMTDIPRLREGELTLNLQCFVIITNYH